MPSPSARCRSAAQDAASSQAEINHFRAVATRYDKRAHVFHGTVTVASLRLWLSP